MKKIRVAVVGVGYLGRFHAEKYAAMPDVELVAVVDADHGRASQIAGKLHTQVIDDTDRLSGLVDAVSVVVPTVHHHRIAKKLLEQGVHVLIEKPITVTLEQADQLIDLAVRKSLVLQVGHIERFNPAVTVVKPLLRSPRYMTAERAAPFTVRCTDVNVVLDLMIHDLDIVMDLAGSAPKEISAAGASIITKEIDTATARIVFHNGCIADVSASRVSDEKKRLLRIFDEGVVYTSDFQLQNAKAGRRGAGESVELVSYDLATANCDTLYEEINAFIRSIRDGAHPAVTGIEGRRALALALTITDNINSGVSGFVPVD